MLSCPARLSISLMSPKLFGTPKVVDELHDVIVRQGSSFKFDIVALKRHSHEPDLERIETLTDMVQHFHRAGSALFQFIDDAILRLELFFLLLKILTAFTCSFSFAT